MSLVSIITILAIFANSWHVIRAWLDRPEGTYVTGIAHYFADYFLYTSLMAQKGFLFTEHLFTNEQLHPTWMYWFYTIIGKLGNPFVVYNIGIVVLSAIALILWWNICKKTSQNPVIAFLFMVTASGFMGYDFWFSPLPALNRLGGVPHQIFQTILLLSVMLLFSRLSEKRSHPLNQKLRIKNQEKNRTFFWDSFIIQYSVFGILIFLAAITNPIQTLLLSIALIVTKPKKILYLLPALLGAVLTNTAFAHDPILKAAKVWENSQNTSVNLPQFILAVGPIALLIPFGFKTYVQNMTPIKKVIFFFGILSIVFFLSPIPKLLGTSPVRWLSPAAYGAFPILAAFGLSHIIFSLNNCQFIRGRVSNNNYLFLSICFLIYGLFTIPSLINQIQLRTNSPRELLYVPKEIVQNLRNLQGDGVILTDPTLPYDVIIPIFTGRKTFTGHPIHTLFPDTKDALRRKYFEGKMTDEEKQKFLSDHNITTIYEP